MHIDLFIMYTVYSHPFISLPHTVFKHSQYYCNWFPSVHAVRCHSNLPLSLFFEQHGLFLMYTLMHCIFVLAHPVHLVSIYSDSYIIVYFKYKHQICSVAWTQGYLCPTLYWTTLSMIATDFHQCMLSDVIQTCLMLIDLSCSIYLALCFSASVHPCHDNKNDAGCTVVTPTFVYHLVFFFVCACRSRAVPVCA